MFYEERAEKDRELIEVRLNFAYILYLHGITVLCTSYNSICFHLSSSFHHNLLKDNIKREESRRNIVTVNKELTL